MGNSLSLAGIPESLAGIPESLAGIPESLAGIPESLIAIGVSLGNGFGAQQIQRPLGARTGVLGSGRGV